ncbi:MAG: aspartyl-tRNA(Asn)/glutamyl-tRNA (Gln) amidotransferase subunit B [Elusimicrobia bacterium]|nr:MAG: aspartyl-tRNA(Asn)/glutamyl-tRNA (Gln) amidotransferase subunit B [Elusimicrobiota bacterium]
MTWELVIGLEVHCQLGTKTKLFCSCSTASFGQPANVNVCPVCTGQPGVLPVLSRGAVELAFSAGLALGCRLEPRSVFARKNYFYPDLPKGYQVSQYELPFSRDGKLNIPGKVVGIHRIHMEEDAGKLVHTIGSEELPFSLVDFNRAGVPLIEIVSEPDMRTAEEAFDYLTNLKAILQYAGISRCDMEKGELRCDANVSVRRPGAPFGTRIEVKNLNSFRSVRDAIEYEAKRQAALIESGGKVTQETRLWDVEASRTEAMRSKEEAHDYRYFPEPDLVPLVADAAWLERLRTALPELPAARKARFMAEHGLSDYDAEVMTGDRALADYFDAAVKAAPAGVTAKAVANWVQSDFLARVKAERTTADKAPVTSVMLAELAGLVSSGKVSGKAAKDVFAKAWETGRNPGTLVAELGLAQVSDESSVSVWVDEAIAENAKAAADVRAGKEAAVGSLVGAVMKRSRGKANPALVNKLIKEKLVS